MIGRGTTIQLFSPFFDRYALILEGDMLAKDTSGYYNFSARKTEDIALS